MTHRECDPGLDTIRRRLLNNIRGQKYAGYDPFDGLNSRLLKASGLDRSPFIRLAWIQLFKRLPVNLRPLTGVPKSRNAKGVALIILGMLRDYARTRDAALLAEATGLGDWLLAHTCPQDVWKYPCWGYPFPWQARAFFVPVGTPNIITTSYVARALWALTEAGGEQRFSAAGNEAARFIAEHLYIEDAGRCYLAYIPSQTTFVHNANLWGAAVLARAGKETDDTLLSDMACRVARQSALAQHADGSWPYGERSHHQFIDSFHTGYNLEALHMIRTNLKTQEFDAAIDSGLDYYRQYFFLDDGTPKYYHDAVYPIDMHAVAQAVLTFSCLGNRDEDRHLAGKVLHWAIRHCYSQRSGYFHYQVNRLFRNRVPYMRWTQAWSYLALATYLQDETQENTS